MIPLATDRITITRIAEDPNLDSYDAPHTYAPYVEHVRATIAPMERGVSEMFLGGQKERIALRLTCDPVDLLYTDVVLDESSGDRYNVAWARQRVGIPPVGPKAGYWDYTEAIIILTQGEM